MHTFSRLSVVFSFSSSIMSFSEFTTHPNRYTNLFNTTQTTQILYPQHRKKTTETTQPILLTNSKNILRWIFLDGSMDVYHKMFYNCRDVYNMYTVYCIVLLIPKYHLFIVPKFMFFFRFQLCFPFSGSMFFIAWISFQNQKIFVNV